MRCTTGLLASVVLMASIAQAALQCYNVHGTALDDSFSPCQPEASVSSCCQLNQSVPDVCLGSGLCLSVRDDYAGTIWGNGCTDQAGNNRDCPQMCAGKVQNSDYWSIMQCPQQGRWCCRAFGDWTSCCNDTSKAVVMGAADVTPQLVSNASYSNSTNYLPEDKTPLIGGVVGGVLGFAFLASFVAAILLWKQNKRLKKSTKGTDIPEYDTSAVSQLDDSSEASNWKSHSHQPTNRVAEADNTPSRYQYTSELDSTNR